MLVLLIFPVLVAGFVACHIHPVESYRLHRYEGQYLYLKSAEFGLYCFFLALVVGLGLHLTLPDKLSVARFSLGLNLVAWLAGAMKNLGATADGEADKMAWFVLLSLLTFLAAWVLKGWAHLRLRRRFGIWQTRVHVIGQILEDSPLDNLLFTVSLVRGRYVMLSMDDRKVYVGKVVNLGEPSATSGMDQDVTLVPLMSGHRDKDTLRVNFDTFYAEVNTGISISLRQDRIVSATEFDFDAYEVWNAPTGEPDTAAKKPGATAPKPRAAKPAASTASKKAAERKAAPKTTPPRAAH
ncbi:MAG: hypothetical protein WC692_12500 [Erythrobacter sp.]|jgi:hypothetical protein